MNSLFTRSVLLHVLITYERRNVAPSVSYGYLASVYNGDGWFPHLSTIEALLYPIGINLYEAFSIIEEKGAEGLYGIEPSEEFLPVMHSRWKMLRVIQQMMNENTGSDTCRSDMAKALEREAAGVGVDFRSKAKTITMLKLEEYAEAAGIRLSEAFRRYYEMYPGDADYTLYPALQKEKTEEKSSEEPQDEPTDENPEKEE